MKKKKKLHAEDVSRLFEEKRIIKEDFTRLAESVASQPPPPNNKPDEEINALQLKISELSNSLRQSKIELNEVQLNNKVYQKQVEQYKDTISSLEEDLNQAEAERSLFILQKSQISKLEDDLRQKSRQLKEMETSSKWIEHELQKAKSQIAQLSSDTSDFAFSITNSDILDLSPTENSVSGLNNQMIPQIYRILHPETSNISQKSGKSEISESSLKINEIPNEILSLKEENTRLMQLSQKYKHLYAKLKGEKKPDEEIPSPEKMKEAIIKLSKSNQIKSDKIKTLKEICEKQHTALQRLIGKPSSGEALSVSLRKIIKELGVAKPDERPGLVQIGERMLDAMLGVAV